MPYGGLTGRAGIERIERMRLSGDSYDISGSEHAAAVAYATEQFRRAAKAAAVVVVEDDPVLAFGAVASTLEADVPTIVCGSRKLPSLIASLTSQRDERDRELSEYTLSFMNRNIRCVLIPESTWSELSPEDSRVRLVFATSGTTSAPKLVPFRLEQVAFIASALAEVLGYRESDVIATSLPASFDYGFYQLILASVAGGDVIVSRGLTFPADAVHAVLADGVTVLPVTPAYARRLLRVMDDLDARAPSVRLVTSTGAPLSVSLVQRLRERFPCAVVLPMYGLTECKRVAVSTKDLAERKPSSVGFPLPGTSIYIRGASGVVGAGERGEIVVTGPHVMDGYLGLGETKTEGVLRTGDLGSVGSEGELYHHGRIALDFIKLYDQRTSVAELEAAVGAAIGERPLRLMPIVDADGLIEAVVVEYEGPAVAEAALQRMLIKELGAVGRALRFVPVRSVQINDSGKVIR